MKVTEEQFSRFHHSRLRRQSATLLLVNLFSKTICRNRQIKSRRPMRVLAALLAWLSLGPFAAHATDFIWHTPSGGDWGFNGNWSGGPHPETFSDTASFNEAGSPSPAPVTLVSVQTPPPFPTIGILNLNVGGYTFQNGTLQLGGAATINVQSHNPFEDFAANATIELFNTATINTEFSDSTLRVAGVITGAVALTKAGPGTLILSGTNTYMGGTTISAGTLQLGNGGTSGSVVGNIVDDGVLAISRSDLITLAGVISGTGSLTQLGPGTLVLAGGNTYTGTTTITGGILSIASGANLGATSSLTFNGGNLLTTGNVT